MSRGLILSLSFLVFLNCCTPKNKKTKVDSSIFGIEKDTYKLPFSDFFSLYCKDSVYQNNHTDTNGFPQKEGWSFNNFYCKNEFVWSIYLNKHEILNINELSDTILLIEYSFSNSKTIVYNFVNSKENWRLSSVEYSYQLFDTHNSNSFFTFLKKFAQDSSFQENRIKFPIKRLESSINEDDHVEYIEKNQWLGMKLWLEATYYPSKSFWSIYSDKEQFYRLINGSSESMVVSALGVETGIKLYLHFIFENGNWFLSKIEDRST